MYLDLAPLEGITGALFRRLYHKYFPGIDRYYTPFISPTSDRTFTPKEQREIFPQFNEGLQVIPQLLTKNAGDFIWAANELSDMGYKEINLNTGCPSGTVTAKGKGAGMLADPDSLKRFLDEIFEHVPCKISVKTRLGMEEPFEFDKILPVFEQYPICELIVHPRVRKDFYRHPVRTDCFDSIYAHTTLPISYNGSIISPDDHAACAAKYPKLQAIMVGQGVISDPFLPSKIRFGAKEDIRILREFHDALFDGYASQFSSRNNAAKRMKEIWIYLIETFEDPKKYKKQLLKTKNADEYETAVSLIFSELKLLPASSGDW